MARGRVHSGEFYEFAYVLSDEYVYILLEGLHHSIFGDWAGSGYT